MWRPAGGPQDRDIFDLLGSRLIQPIDLIHLIRTSAAARSTRRRATALLRPCGVVSVNASRKGRD